MFVQVRFPTVIVDECTQAAETAALASWSHYVFAKGPKHLRNELFFEKKGGISQFKPYVPVVSGHKDRN